MASKKKAAFIICVIIMFWAIMLIPVSVPVEVQYEYRITLEDMCVPQLDDGITNWNKNFSI